MIVDIFCPIFTLTITILACFIKKIAKLFRDLHTRVFQGIALDPFGGLKAPPRPLASIVFVKNRCTHIFFFFFLHYPLPVYYYLIFMFF